MIRIVIGDVESEISGISESWINQHINRRRAAGQNVNVKVVIHTDRLNMILTTPGCSVSNPGRAPNQNETAIFNLWEQYGLNTGNFTGGNLIAFLKKLKAL